MTFALWCVAISVFLPLVWIGYAKIGVDNYDNAEPRPWRDTLTGKHRRAMWAETNAYEMFPPFAAGVIITHYVGVGQPIIDVLAGVYLCARVLHGVFYIRDKHLLRSLSWAVSFFSMVGLYLAAGWAA